VKINFEILNILCYKVYKEVHVNAQNYIEF